MSPDDQHGSVPDDPDRGAAGEPARTSAGEPARKAAGDRTGSPAASGAHDGLAEPPRCSAKGCRAVAVSDLRWRNPRLHAVARVKHWLACPAHAEELAAFLDRRGFLLERVPLS